MNNTNINISTVLFSINEESSNNYRKLSHKKLCLLLVKDNDNYRLPSYKMDRPISIEKAPDIAIKNDTGLENIFSEQLYTFSHIENDTFSLNPTYLSLFSKNNLSPLKDNCYWFDIEVKEEKNKFLITLNSEIETINLTIKKELKTNTNDRYWFYNETISKLKSNDAITIICALERLKNKINYTDIIFNIMPPTFSLKELQQAFEIIQNKKLLDPAFRRIITNKVEETGEYLQGIGCRPSKLYKYKRNDNNEKN